MQSPVVENPSLLNLPCMDMITHVADKKKHKKPRVAKKKKKKKIIINNPRKIGGNCKISCSKCLYDKILQKIGNLLALLITNQSINYKSIKSIRSISHQYIMHTLIP